MNSKKLIESKADIMNFFCDAAVEKKELLLGIEVEKSGVFEKDMQPVNYYGHNGYAEILKKLVKEVGWKIIDQDEKGNIFALKRGDTYINTEADGRFELASKPRRSLFSLNREYRMHENEIIEISKYFGVRWISSGLQPFASNKQLPILPKKRFELIKHYFANANGGTGYLVKNNGIHINFGFTSEKHAIKQFQTMYKVAPIISAMFANSPLNSGKFAGFMDRRLDSCQNFDPARNGVRKEFLEKDFNFEKWIDYVIDLPVFYIERRVSGVKKFIKFDGKTTFRDFIKSGFKKSRPLIKDFVLHLKSVWTEVRIKKYIEYRGIDTVPPSLMKSTAAIVKGLVFNTDAMNAACDLVNDLSFEEYCQMRDDANKYGLQAEVRGIKVLDYAKKLLDISTAGLRKINKQYNLLHDESRFLWPIKEYVFVREQSPAEYVMEMWKGEWHKDPRKLLEWSEK